MVLAGLVGRQLLGYPRLPADQVVLVVLVVHFVLELLGFLHLLFVLVLLGHQVDHEDPVDQWHQLFLQDLAYHLTRDFLLGLDPLCHLVALEPLVGLTLLLGQVVQWHLQKV